MKTILKYTLKELISLLFFCLGGVYCLKLVFKNMNALIILNYHNFSKYNNYKFKRGNILETGYASNFEKQICFLKKHFNFCYPEEFFEGEGNKGINILITFDDGYKDNHDIALPILERYRVPTIFFLTTSYINSDKWLWHDKVRLLIVNRKLDSYTGENHLINMNKGQTVASRFSQFVSKYFPDTPPKRLMMDWSEVEAITNRGFKIGTHTCNHLPLTSIKREQQAFEIIQSIRAIENRINIKCKYLAYPNGLYNEDTVLIMNDTDIKFGFTTKNGINKLNAKKMLLKRIGVNASDSIYILVFKLLLQLPK